MIRTFLAPLALCLLVSSLLAVADPTPGPADEPAVTSLISQLGSANFTQREAAERRLDALGARALEPLRNACQSPNAEVARRARELVTRIERRVENERALAPTAVELRAKDAPIGDVLADLSKQSGYKVVLSKEAASELAGKTVTVEASGKVPFWTAVLNVCDAAGLKVGAVGGLVAPGSALALSSVNDGDRRPRPGPQTPARPPAGRAAVGSGSTIVLEPRGAHPRRPLAVYGAVLIEAYEIPKGAAVNDASTALLQVWPEPKLNWQTTTGIRVERATDDAGQFRTAVLEAGAPQNPRIVRGNGVVFVQQAGGGVVLVNQNATVPVPVDPAFVPNPQQAVLKLKLEARRSTQLAELSGVVLGVARSAPQPLVCLKDLKPGTEVKGVHAAGVEMKAVLQTRDGRRQVVVELVYDPNTVLPGEPGASPSGGTSTEVIIGRRGVAGRRLTNHFLLGLQVTDADGNRCAFTPTILPAVLPANGGHIVYRATLELTGSAEQTSDTVAVAFWGTHVKSVEVPFTLKGVPLSGGKN